MATDTAPATVYGSTGNQPTFGNGAPSGLTTQQWNDLQEATQVGTACVTQGHGAHGGGGCSNASINSSVLNYLQGTGRWSSDELSQVAAGIGALGGGPSGHEEGGDAAPFATQWFNAAASSITSWLQSVLPPGQGGAGNNPAFSGAQPTFGDTTGSASGGGSGTGATATTDPISQLLGLLPSLVTPAATTTSSGSGDTTQPASGGTTYVPVATSSGGSSSSALIPLVIVAIAVALGFWYFEHRRKDGKKATE